MVDELTFESLWPHKVVLRDEPETYTDAFAWLWKQIFDQVLDYQVVFTTFGNRTVAFGSDYKQLAMMFKLKFG